MERETLMKYKTYSNQLKEALLDKGFPLWEMYDRMRLLSCMPNYIEILDPTYLNYEGAKEAALKSRHEYYERNSKDYLFKVQFMRPVWNQYANFEYEI